MARIFRGYRFCELDQLLLRRETRIMKTHIGYPAEKNSKAGLAFTFLCALGVLCGKGFCPPAWGQEKSDANHLKDTVREINDRMNGQLESLQTLYKSIHTHPELSLQEEHTSAKLAGAARSRFRGHRKSRRIWHCRRTQKRCWTDNLSSH